MAAITRSTVVGIFEDRRRADEAISALRAAGFREDQIGVVTKHPESVGHDTATADAEKGSKWEEGALAGILTGIGLGGLVGLGVLSGVIPVVGPAIVAGTWGTILTNAAGGAALVGLAGALVGAGIPEEEARFYESEVKAGRTLVTVKADARADEATTIMRRFGAYDMHTAGTSRAAVSSTAEGVQTCATGTPTTASASSAGTAAGAQKIRVHEEQLHATKQPVETGEVRVHKEVHTEHKTLEVPVRREEVVIERHPVAGQSAPADAIREGEEIRIPVKEEQVRVEKTPVVKEEVTVGKRVVQDTEKVSGTVRKEEVKVKREGDVDVRTKDQGTRPKP